MKKITIATISVISGVVLTLLVISGFNTGKKSLHSDSKNGIPVKSVLYTSDDQGKAVPLDFTAIAGKVMDAVVNIQSTQTLQYADQGQMPEQFREFFDDDFFRYFFGPEQRQQPQQQPESPPVRMGIGSGVIINPDGYIITNNHVVADATELQVTLHDNRSYEADVVGTDPATDLALIRIKEKNLPVIPLVNSDEVQVGEWVLAVGNPYGLTSTVTAGIVSAKARALNILPGENSIESFIQTDAAINPGNSGGALVNLQGGLVGINTAIASPTGSYSGYGFAISSNLVNKVIEDLIKYGVVQRGFLGVVIRNITSSFAEEQNLKVNQGAYVDSVLQNSAAAKTGIKKGDVIVSVDGADINQASQLQERIARHRPGENVTIRVNRNGEPVEFTAVLQNSEGTTKLVSSEKGSMKNTLGADFKAIDKNMANKLSVDGGVQITRLGPGLLSKQTDIREGFIITKVNDQPVKTVDELMNILEKRKGNGIMMEGVYENSKETFFYAFGLK